LALVDKKKSIKALLPPVGVLVVLAASLICSFVPALASVCIFDRQAVLHGQLWRLITCHLVHFSFVHFTYDALAFGVAGAIFRKKHYPYFVSFCLLAAICISGLLLLLKPHMAFYGGLSGIACGALYFCALLGLLESGPWQKVCLLTALFLPGKIAMEFLTGAPMLPYGNYQTFIPVQESHVIGCFVAVLFYLGRNISISGSHPLIDQGRD